MYIWVVLATFLAMLASYTLSIRSDIRTVTVEPLAEAEIGKLVTKHRAAQAYIRFRQYPYTNNSDPNYADFQAGVLTTQNVNSYLPFGHVNDLRYVSQMFCMNENMTTAYSGSGSNNPCSVRTNNKILITYGKIPLRWLNQGTSLEEPINDFMNAMRNMVEGGIEMGYTAPVQAGTSTQKNISNSSVRIINRDRDDMYVPRAIVNDATFKSVCDLTKSEVCLVYLTRF